MTVGVEIGSPSNTCEVFFPVRFVFYLLAFSPESLFYRTLWTFRNYKLLTHTRKCTSLNVGLSLLVHFKLRFIDLSRSFKRYTNRYGKPEKASERATSVNLWMTVYVESRTNCVDRSDIKPSVLIIIMFSVLV